MSLTELSLAPWERLVSDIPAGDGKIANLFLQCTLGEPIFGVKVALMHLKGKNTGTSTEELKTVQSHFGCIGERVQHPPPPLPPYTICPSRTFNVGEISNKL